MTSTSTITYTLVTGCTSTTVVTVNPLPVPIVGATTICVASSTILSDATAGGTWSSSNSSVATILPGPGLPGGTLYGESGGTSRIIYTLIATGCTNTTNITVNPLPTIISGTTTICGGQTAILSDGTSGGTWSSNTTAITITPGPGAGGGIVTGALVAAQSTATVTYTVGSGCFITTVVTVNPLPAPITGSITMCAGTTAALSDLSPGGTWSTGNSVIATVDPFGHVTATPFSYPAPVYDLPIFYGLPSGCIATTTVIVNPLPAAIGGPTTVCEGSTINLSDAATGGIWSSTNSSVATVVAAAGTGVVTGGSTGGLPSVQVIIDYASGSGCIMTKTITVNIQPTAIINGALSICDHSSSPLSDAIANGVWTSGNTNIATVDPALGVVTGSIPGAGVGGGNDKYYLQCWCLPGYYVSSGKSPAGCNNW